MSSSDDNPDRSNIASADELNPLLNPILSQNMGRWAEVYFNSPPERRDQEVLRLIRELQGQIPVREKAGAPMPSFQNQGASAAAAPSRAVDSSAPSLTCAVCGYVNRPQHKFCGRCGGRLDLAPQPPPGGIDTRSRGPFSVSPEEFSGRLSQRENLSRDDGPIFGTQPESAWQSYRPYVGVVVAIVVVGLAYFAWRGNTTSTGASPLPSQVPPASTEASNPVSTPAPATPTGVAPPPSASPASSPQSVSPQPSTPTSASRDATSQAAPANAAAPDPVAVGAPPAVQTQASAGKGSEELAAALDFMNGTNGRPQNSNAAVQWLWKAVSKENVQATVLLSSLYLRGDLVPKNCEQARVLLDAAAIKGSKDAGERLRNLRAFGCE